ncbi:MAG: glycosyltransferase [Jatrophihabitans sp.]
MLTSVGALDSDEYREYIEHEQIPIAEAFRGPAPLTTELVSVIAAVCKEQDVHTVVIMDGDLALRTWWYVAVRAFRRLPRRPRVIFFLTRYPARLELREQADLKYWRIRFAKAMLLVLARLTGSIDRAAGFAGRDERAEGWLVKRARDPAMCLAHARDRVALRARLGLPADRSLVGIFGGINVRKNPPLVLDAVERAGPDVDLVLAGPVSEDTRDWLSALPAERRARVIVADGFLPNGVLDSYLAACDVVALVMTLEGPSGVMGKAIAAGVPVVTAGSKTRARELRAVHTGAATEWSAEAIAVGIRIAVRRPQTPPQPGRLAMPTPESFAAAILGDSDDGRRTSLGGRLIVAIAANVRYWLRR